MEIGMTPLPIKSPGEWRFVLNMLRERESLGKLDPISHSHLMGQIAQIEEWLKVNVITKEEVLSNHYKVQRCVCQSPIAQLSFEEGVRLLNKAANVKKAIEYNGLMININELKLKTFLRKGTTCACCGAKGSFWQIENSDTRSKVMTLNLYADAVFGGHVLLTIDHVIPISQGGVNGITNTQVMCYRCNNIKGNRFLDINTKNQNVLSSAA